MKSRTLFLFTVCAVTTAALACSNAKTTTPVAPSLTNTSGPSGETLKASAPTVQSPTNDIKLTSPVVVLSAGPASLQFETAGVALQYRFEVMNAAGTVVDNALVNSTTYQVASPLAENTRHTWHVRAEALGDAGPWSGTGSFITLDPAIVLDPLTDGKTVGRRIGGQFIPGVGWQSMSVTNAIQYDIPTCDNCTVEFDITNIGKGEGNCCGNDLKFLSMGDADAWGSFGAFRDHRWKMHFIQRADGDGTGLEIIFRNGGTDPEGNPGDHRIKMLGGGPDFRDTSVFHVVIKWSPAGYNISVGTNGGPLEEYLEDGFGGIPYAPPNHRVELGCTPRAEGFPAAIYRNVKIAKNR
jgi:hypothetical protein